MVHIIRINQSNVRRITGYLAVSCVLIYFLANPFLNIFTNNNGGNTYRVMSYNMFGWNTLRDHPWKAQNVYRTIKSISPDILGAQETLEKKYQQQISANLNLELVGNGIVKNSSQQDFAGLAIFYNKTRFILRVFGIEMIHERDENGQRAVQWAHFDSWTGQRVDFFNTHLCVKCKDKYKSSERLLQVIQQHRSHRNSQVLLTGDLNDDENTTVIRTLNGDILDTYRLIHPGGDGTTYLGLGKLDYIFASSNMFKAVKDATIFKLDTNNSSDHFPVLADIFI